MAYYINNLELGDKYTAASTLGPFMETDTVTVLVSGEPANMQFYVGDEATGRWTDEREYTAAAGPGTTNSFKVSNVRGIRMRNANAGQAAVASATLFRTGVTYDSWDPIFDAGSLSPGTITASGQVTPAGLVSGITGQVDNTGHVTGGSGFTITKNGVGDYTIDYTTPFAGTPTVIFQVIESVSIDAASIIIANNNSQTRVLFYRTPNGIGTPVDQGFYFVALPTA